MALIDRGIMPKTESASALVAFARRCPDCPAIAAADLVPMSGRTAFTGRLTADQAHMLDRLTLDLRRELGRPKLDKAEMLAALIGLADENRAVFGVLAARMHDSQAS